MMTVSELADALGRKQIAEAVGVNASAVSNALARGGFPATWYESMSKLAKLRGIECPLCLFIMAGRPGWLSNRVRDEVIRLRKEGVKIKQIVDQLGISQSAIGKIMKDAR